MAIFKNVFRRLRFWKRTTAEPDNSEHDLTRTLKRYEYFVYKTRRILLWESPSETLFTIAVVNLFFWLFASLEWRFYRIVFTVLLLTTLHELWTKQIWPEIRVHEPTPQIADDIDVDDPQNASLVRLSHFLTTTRKCFNDYYVWLKNMREKRPGLFCTLMTGVFVSLSFVGRVIPGLVLVYLVVMVGLFAPGIWVHLIPEEKKKLIAYHLSSLHHMLYHTGDDLPSEEDYLPEASNEDLSLLSQFVDPENEDMNSRGSSATPLSFATSQMPSHEDSVDSLATFSDLDLNLETTPRTVHNVEDLSDDSSAENDIGIDFRTGHFNGDESSSEEEEKLFAKDLKFADTTMAVGDSVTCSNAVTASSAQQAMALNAQQASLTNFISSNIIGLTSAIGQSYFANVLNRGVIPDDKQETIVKNNSTDSLLSEEDFEMISHEDVS